MMERLIEMLDIFQSIKQNVGGIFLNKSSHLLDFNTSSKCEIEIYCIHPYCRLKQFNQPQFLELILLNVYSVLKFAFTLLEEGLSVKKVIKGRNFGYFTKKKILNSEMISTITITNVAYYLIPLYRTSSTLQLTRSQPSNIQISAVNVYILLDIHQGQGIYCPHP